MFHSVCSLQFFFLSDSNRFLLAHHEILFWQELNMDSSIIIMGWEGGTVIIVVGTLERGHNKTG